jgi:hypothetical protein
VRDRPVLAAFTRHLPGGLSDLPPSQKRLTRVYRDLANNVPVAPLGDDPSTQPQKAQPFIGVAAAVAAAPQTLHLSRRFRPTSDWFAQIGDDAFDLGECVGGQLSLRGLGSGIGFFEVAEDEDILVVERACRAGVVEAAGDDEAFVTISLW